MISIHVIIDFFAGGLLLTTFLMMGKIRLIPMLRYFAVSSFFLAGLGASMSLLKEEKDFFIAPLATILFKVVFIPLIINFTAKKLPSSNQLKMYFRPATTSFMFLFVLILSGIIVRNFPVTFDGTFDNPFFFKSLLFISISLILSGILLTVIRKDLFSQVLGLLTMENGIAAFGLVTLDGIPIFLEMGISFVIIISTVILAVLIDRVHEVYTIGDTENLKELID
ncbi:hypothetical protein HYV56_01775 [Candidatus Peregrinibacteria bacterium]|nr:hypothetical protein [Candidatus Peregrinibacteria bacterium]